MPKISDLKYLYDERKKGDDWIEKVPYQISDSYFDNPYVNSIFISNDKLIKMAFGEYADAVDWFLNEWQKGLGCGMSGEWFNIETPEEYYDYLVKHEGWEDDR